MKITITLDVPEGTHIELGGAGAVPPSLPQSAEPPLTVDALDHEWACPVHHTGRTIPAGTSKRTGKPYSAFRACTEPGCAERPPR